MIQRAIFTSCPTADADLPSSLLIVTSRNTLRHRLFAYGYFCSFFPNAFHCLVCVFFDANNDPLVALESPVV